MRILGREWIPSLTWRPYGIRVLMVPYRFRYELGKNLDRFSRTIGWKRRFLKYGETCQMQDCRKTMLHFVFLLLYSSYDFSDENIQNKYCIMAWLVLELVDLSLNKEPIFGFEEVKGGCEHIYTMSDKLQTVVESVGAM
ncbi:hypothetical protein CEXT_685751 [Caerostris extrusa]|uniref:Uncharacterized protein n=1 Tax=Caerostris extrusa TaxID=172846 RepID=A0AAV4N7D8_CAEEX|nr:hypothetical protein CEXT_685751 [Caerostris extrusa]